MPSRHVVALALFAALATAGGIVLARRSGGYAPAATASGTVTVAPTPGAGAAFAGTYPAQYCASYGNVAQQVGYAYTADLGGRGVLTLADAAGRAPGAQDPARAALTLTAGARRWAWGPGRRGSVVLSDDLLTARVDALLAGPAAGDTVPLRATFACRPRVKPKPRR